MDQCRLPGVVDAGAAASRRLAESAELCAFLGSARAACAMQRGDRRWRASARVHAAAEGWLEWRSLPGTCGRMRGRRALAAVAATNAERCVDEPCPELTHAYILAAWHVSPVGARACVYVCMCCVCARVCAYVCVSVRVCVYMCVRMCARMCECGRACVSVQCVVPFCASCPVARLLQAWQAGDRVVCTVSRLVLLCAMCAYVCVYVACECCPLVLSLLQSVAPRAS